MVDYKERKMRKLIMALLLVGAIGASAQTDELIQFSSGQPARASDVNSNFSNLDTRLKALEAGSCSAKQDGSSVVITCADGSSGVLATNGIVIVYPEPVHGEIIQGSISTGDIVLIDGNDVVLGLGTKTSSNYYKSGGFTFENVNSTQTVKLLPERSNGVYFTGNDCEGTFLVNAVAFVNGQFYIPSNNRITELTLFKSYIDLGGVGSCYNGEWTYKNLAVPQEINPPEEFLNAAYPIRLEQLP